MEIEKIKNDVKNMLSKERYTHTLGVEKRALELAKIYEVNEEAAQIAAILHDMAKELTKQEKLNYAKENQLEVDEIEKSSPGLLHAKIAADMAKKKYHIAEEIQSAITYHTTGRQNMSMLDKIIFVADATEENREYADLEEIRELSEKNLNEAIITIINFNIQENIEKGKLLHPNSILARNQLLIEKMK